MTPASMDSLEAPLNPCSVESIPEPVELSDGSRIWPVMLSCYELQDNGKRQGQMDLFAVKVPDMSKKKVNPSMVLRFGSPLRILSHEESKKSGILDGKWIRSKPNPSDDTKDGSCFYFASAHSSGEIIIHSCTVFDDERYPRLESEHPFTVKQVGRSECLSYRSVPPLCLALNWDSTVLEEGPSRVVSSYSDGRVAIHDVERQQTGDELRVIERDSWEAHTLFTNPSEVWSVGFVGDNGNAIMSGGDDGSAKLWDVRSTSRPMQVLKHFNAGVTVIAPHPRQHNLVACGSYDETVCLYDVRYLSSRKPLGHSGPLGGGIWRIKWHPYDDNRILVAAMHGGCRIIQIDGSEETPPLLTATKEFTEHTSMAYGADWLVCNHPSEESGYFEAAASCSFYDKAVHLWDTVG